MCARGGVCAVRANYTMPTDLDCPVSLRLRVRFVSPSSVIRGFVLSRGFGRSFLMSRERERERVCVSECGGGVGLVGVYLRANLDAWLSGSVYWM